ncbi:MAG TPA: DUF2157 domain-containing protein [Acidimicrobiales bacterium]
MIVFAVVLLVGVVVWAAAQATGRRRVAGGTPRRRVDGPPGLASDLARWTDAGLLSDAQASAIVAWESDRAAAPPAPPSTSRVPIVAEALGYLGGALGVAGLGLVVARYWPDVPTVARVALSALVALALLAAGALVREQADPALARLRWFLWLGSAGASALAAGVLVADGLGADALAVAAAAGLAVAIHSGPLWWGHVRPLQQAAALGGLAVAAGTALAWLTATGPGGLAVMAVGAGYLAAGLRTSRPVTTLTVAAGAVTVAVGAAVVAGGWEGPGLVLAVLAAFALLAVAAVPGAAPRVADQRTTAVVGAVALTQFVPGAIGYFAQDAGAATGVTTWLVGVALMAVGARRLVRQPQAVEALGALAVLGGAAVTGVQWGAAAPVFGLVSAIALVALGMLPGRVALSLAGTLGLLVNVPWAISRLFPGEGRAPLLILAAGMVLVAISVLLTRDGHDGRRRLGGAPPRPRRAGP